MEQNTCGQASAPVCAVPSPKACTGSRKAEQAAQLLSARKAERPEQHEAADDQQSDGKSAELHGSSPRQSAIHRLRSISVKHLFGIKPSATETATQPETSMGSCNTSINEPPMSALVTAALAEQNEKAVRQQNAELHTIGVQGPAMSAMPIPGVTPGQDQGQAGPHDKAGACSNIAVSAQLSPRRSISLAKLRSQSLAKGSLQPHAQSSLDVGYDQDHAHSSDSRQATLAAKPSTHSPQPHQTSNADVQHHLLLPGIVHYAGQPDVMSAAPTSVQEHQAAACAPVNLSDIDLGMSPEGSNVMAGDSVTDWSRTERAEVLTQPVKVSISTDGQRASMSLEVTDTQSEMQVPLVDTQLSATNCSEKVQLAHQQSSAAGEPVELPQQLMALALQQAGSAAGTDQGNSAAGQYKAQPQPEAQGSAERPLPGSSPTSTGRSSQGLLSRLEGGLRSLLYRSRSQVIQQPVVGNHALSVVCISIGFKQAPQKCMQKQLPCNTLMLL